MPNNEKWLRYDESIREISAKFMNSDDAKSIFLHCLKTGIIRSRTSDIRKIVAPVQYSDEVLGYVDLDGNVASEAWIYADLGSKHSDTERDIFCLVSPWGQPLATIHNVTFNRSDISDFVTRKGVGGAPFKKAHWFRMTSVLLDLALKGDFDQFGGYDDFLTYLDEEINGSGDALDRSSLHRPAQQFWKQFKRHESS